MSTLLVAALTLFLLWPSLVAAHDAHGHGGSQLTVMTQNVYVGFDVDAAVAAILSGDLGRIVATAKASWDAARASDFHARARRIAEEIAERRPDVVGLQEVSLFRSQEPSDFSPIPNASNVEIDFLEVLLNALRERGLRYEPVAIIANADTELPALRADFTCCFDIRLTDHDVILVRRGAGRVRNVQEQNFATNLSFPVPGGVFTVLRGWVAVDMKVGDRFVRFVTTHLDPLHPGVQFAQGLELINGPLNTALPLVVLGDFNSRADGLGTATYGLLVSSGLEDTWTELYRRKPGYTCCQAANLLNPTSTLSERIDIIFTKGRFDVLDADVVGDRQRDRTESGLWPSDHAGVVSELRLLKKR